MLIDNLVRHFSDWWLFGTNKALSWGFEMDDICEQWVLEGETGGIATLLCFILLVVYAIPRIGKARKQVAPKAEQKWFLWLIGIALLAHCVGFWGISYFDNTVFSWYTLLCIISAATKPVRSTVNATQFTLGKSTKWGNTGVPVTPKQPAAVLPRWASSFSSAESRVKQIRFQ